MNKLEMAPLLMQVFPGVPPGVIGAFVAVANAALVVLLAWLGFRVLVRLIDSWHASNFERVRGRRVLRDAIRNSRAPVVPGGARPIPFHGSAPSDEHAKRNRIRDRFVHVRFDGTLKGFRDLSVPEKVVKAARLYFEDGQGARADELLAFALRHHPEITAYWLARLEICFLVQDAARFVQLAESFRNVAPAAPEWAEINALGVRLAPESDLFKAHARAEDHYGAWPSMPNWIQSPWDMTGELLACEFHQHMRRRLDLARGGLVRSFAGAH